MEIVVTGRQAEVTDAFRTRAQEKLAKVAKLCPKAIRVEVEVSRERNPRLADVRERVQLTCISRGPAVRAEAGAANAMAAFDLAWSKLEARLRKAADRRRVHRGSRTPVSVAAATADSAGPLASQLEGVAPASGEPEDDGLASPDGIVADVRQLVVRDKTHRAAPMTLEQAFFEMELVGHDFFLFTDADTALPSVLYRRRGYDYGVIRLDAEPEAASASGGHGMSEATG